MKAEMDALQQEAQSKGRRLLDLEDELAAVGQESLNWLRPKAKVRPR